MINNPTELNAEILKHEKGISELSTMISQEIDSLIPKPDDIINDLATRVVRLWYMYVSRGVNLSTGGVSESIFNIKDLKGSTNIQTFNMYRSDRKLVATNQETTKVFLMEEGVLSTTDTEKIAVSFCLGSHEGIMRVARCIYKSGVNDEILFPIGGYGILAIALETMQPVGYKIRLANVDRKNGEKVLLSELEKLAEKHKNAKTLLLELKTTAGAIYSIEELKNIINFCKKNGIFLIADATHSNMEFNRASAFIDVGGLCQALNYHEFSIIHTGSKTYGLERARIGFIVLSKLMTFSSFETIEMDLFRVLGAGFDLPFEVSNFLLKLPLSKRKDFLHNHNQKHRFNMNLMIAYIEGVNSFKIDDDIREKVALEIDPPYQEGIQGLKIVYKPDGGIHMKIETSGLRRKYLTNILISNSEIFCYALNKLTKVVTLHSYCITDPDGFGMRLSFSIKEDVHKGMKLIHDFVNLLTDLPIENKNLPNLLIEELNLSILKAMKCIDKAPEPLRRTLEKSKL